MSAFAALLKKDLSLEWRRRETLTLMLCLSLLLCLVVAVGVNSTFLPSAEVAKIFAPLVWIISIFAATVSLGRSYEYELEQHALDGLILSGVALWKVFLAKVTANFSMTLLAQIVAIVTLAAFLNITVESIFVQLVFLSVIVLWGYACLATLLGALSAQSSLKAMLLPLILLPLVFPLFFSAVELSIVLMDSGQLDTSSFWFSLLIALFILYTGLGCMLFEFAVRE